MRKAERLIVHIGTPKTGTTTLQRALDANRSKLRAAGVLYPAPPKGRTNHNLLTAALGPQVRLQREFLQSTDANTARGNAVRYVEALRQEVRGSGAEVVVLSAEYVYGLPDAAAQALRAMLDDLADQIDAVCYLRDPASYYLSMTQQRVKASYLIRPPATMRMHARARLSTHLDTFGGRVRVRSARRQDLCGGDIVTDFVETFLPELSGASWVSASGELNRSMSSEAMCILQSVRRHGWPDDNDRFAPESNMLVQVLNDLWEVTSQTRPSLRPEIEARYVAEHADDIRFVEDRFGVRLVDQRPTAPDVACADPPGWHAEDLREILHVDRDSVERVLYLVLKELTTRR